MQNEIVKIELNPAIDEARRQYGNMQRSWWGFAVAIHEISTSRAFIDAGFDNFKEFCVEEYPSTNYSTMLKFVSVVSCFQDAIEDSLEEDPDFLVPSYEACYTVSTLYGKDLPNKEVSTLFNDVLESRVSYTMLRAKIKEISNRSRVPLPIGATPVEAVSNILFDIRSLIAELPNVSENDASKITQDLKILSKSIRTFFKLHNKH